MLGGESSPLLDRFEFRFPSSFYNAFSDVFGQIEEEKEAFFFLEELNQIMNQRRGGGIVQIEEIVYLREQEFFKNGLYIYNEHHVVPISRDGRRRVEADDQVVRLPEKFHASWHGVFFNLYDGETIDFLERFLYILRKKMEFDYSGLQKLAGSIMQEKKYRV